MFPGNIFDSIHQPRNPIFVIIVNILFKAKQHPCNVHDETKHLEKTRGVLTLLEHLTAGT